MLPRKDCREEFLDRLGSEVPAGEAPAEVRIVNPKVGGDIFVTEDLAKGRMGPAEVVSFLRFGPKVRARALGDLAVKFGPDLMFGDENTIEEKFLLSAASDESGGSRDFQFHWVRQILIHFSHRVNNKSA